MDALRLPDRCLRGQRVPRYPRRPLGSFSVGIPSCRPISLGRASRPRLCVRSRWARATRLMRSDMCTGMRMARDRSATALVMASRMPPRGVGGELEPLRVVELLDRLDQTEVPLLGEIEERHPVGGVALGDRDHQAQVRLDQPLRGDPPVVLHPTEEPDRLRAGPWPVRPSDRLEADAPVLKLALRVEPRSRIRPRSEPRGGTASRSTLFAGSTLASSSAANPLPPFAWPGQPPERP